MPINFVFEIHVCMSLSYIFIVDELMEREMEQVVISLFVNKYVGPTI